MTWLNAALAFAITMLILSMVTSVFVETLHRFIGLREKGLKLLVGHVFDRVIAPYLDTQGLKSEQLKNEFVDLMTVNRAPAGEVRFRTADTAANAATLPAGETPGDLSKDAAGHETGLISGLWSGRRLARLEATEFMSRLGGSAFGDSIRNAIQSAGLDDPEQALKGLAESFDQFGSEASVFFERRARLLAVLAALVVSIAMYVHPYALFHTHLTSPETALNVIARQDDVMKQYSDAVAASSAAQPSGSASEKEVIDELKASLEKAKTAAADATKTLSDAGAPIGWTPARWDEFKLLWGSGETKWTDRGQSLQALFWLIIGGLLVGLGGPFWYDMVNSLSSIRSLLGGDKSKSDAAGEASGSKGPGNAQPQTPVDHFHTGAANRDASLALAGDGDDDNDSTVG